MRTAMLIGESGVDKLKNSSVLLFGVGGVALVGVSAHFLKQQYIIANTKLENIEKYKLYETVFRFT